MFRTKKTSVTRVEGLKYQSFTNDVMFIRGEIPRCAPSFIYPFLSAHGVVFPAGRTLERFLHDPELSKEQRPGHHWFWVYEPTAHMVEIQCDDCTKRHNPRNLACSASMQTMSDATDPNRLYGFHKIDDKSLQKRNITLNYIDYGRQTRIKGCIVKLVLPTP